jgi:hypothetical protein
MRERKLDTFYFSAALFTTFFFIRNCKASLLHHLGNHETFLALMLKCSLIISAVSRRRKMKLSRDEKVLFVLLPSQFIFLSFCHDNFFFTFQINFFCSPFKSQINET